MRKRLLAVCVAAMFVSVAAISGETIKVLSIVPSMAGAQEYYLAVAAKYEQENPGTAVKFEFLDHVSFKAKLPTLLQSSEQPDAFSPGPEEFSTNRPMPGCLRTLRAR